VCASESWKHSHNVVHHNHTNIVGLDKDFGYANFRIDELQEWKRRHRFQLLTKAIAPFVFEWGIGVQDAEPIEMREGRITREEFLSRLGPFKRKAKQQIMKDYVLLPAIALWHWPRVLLGNIVANVLRSMWTCFVIFCGHFTTSVHAYTIEETREETRGQWYARQIRGSANISGSRLLYLMTGHLSHQIEHHLFPDMPAHRYPEIAPQVKAICKKYGLEYNEASLWRQYASVLKRITRHARRPDGFDALPA
jgi:linoleoyl-CoA desaturase